MIKSHCGRPTSSLAPHRCCSRWSLCCFSSHSLLGTSQGRNRQCSPMCHGQHVSPALNVTFWIPQSSCFPLSSQLNLDGVRNYAREEKDATHLRSFLLPLAPPARPGRTLPFSSLLWCWLWWWGPVRWPPFPSCSCSRRLATRSWKCGQFDQGIGQYLQSQGVQRLLKTVDLPSPALITIHPVVSLVIIGWV